MNQPTVFLSSTIYDFRDVRSALKYYLEQQGCEVLASEFNDFRKPIDVHSYDACLASIRKADYFILLIGSRVGGWYDAANRVSITQQEYRAAYELHKQGRLNILTFVRGEVWQVKEDRKALERHLETVKLDDTEKQKVMQFQSKFANDAEFISTFIDEVGRNNETKQAVEAGEIKPTGNWIHVFKDFEDIVGAIRPLLFSGLPVQEAAFRKALEAELLEILASCMLKTSDKGGALSPVGAIKAMSKRCPIKNGIRDGDTLELPTSEWDRFSFLMMHLIACHIHMIVLPDALSSATFFDFDPSEGAFVETDVSRSLAKLIAEVRRFSVVNSGQSLALIYAHSRKNRPRDLTEITVDAFQLAGLYHLSYRWGNIVQLCEALLQYLQTGVFVEPIQFPFSPIAGLDEEISKEKLTPEEVGRYLKLQRASKGEA